MIRKLASWILSLGLLCSPLQAKGSTSTTTAQLFFSELVRVASKQDLDQRKFIVNALVDQHFDFENFYQQALIDYWDSWSPLQKANFDRSFRTRFISNLARHLTRLDRVAAATVRYKVEEEDGDRAVVLATGQAEDVTVVVRLFLVRHQESWQVYDLDIADAKLSRNYRGQFNYLIQNKGYTGLLDKLRNLS